MALSAPKPCRQPGCPAYQERAGYCEDHQHKAWDRHYDDSRGTSSQRGYDARWQRVRKKKLGKQPMCEYCEREPATEVDHVIPINDGGPRYDMRNLKSACHRCHMQKHAATGTSAPGAGSPRA